MRALIGERAGVLLVALARRATAVPARIWWIAAAAWYGLIFALSQAPGTDAASTESLLDLLSLGGLNGLVRVGAHMGLFGTLALLVYVAAGSGSLEPDVRRAVVAVAAAAFLGVTDEVHQHYVPGRHGRAVDVLVDALGAAVVLWLALFCVARARRRQLPVVAGSLRT